MSLTDDSIPDRAIHFGYFVVQMRATQDTTGVEVTGVLEDLGTGEKRTFSSGDGLARLVSEWATRTGVPP